MTVPGEGHEDVGGKQHQDRQERRRNGGHRFLLLGSRANQQARNRVPCNFAYHLISNTRKSGASLQAHLKAASKKPATVGNTRHTAPLFREGTTKDKTIEEATKAAMQFDWRAISGPALITATAVTAFVVDPHLIAVPNPPPLLVCVV